MQTLPFFITFWVAWPIYLPHLPSTHTIWVKKSVNCEGYDFFFPEILADIALAVGAAAEGIPDPGIEFKYIFFKIFIVNLIFLHIFAYFLPNKPNVEKHNIFDFLFLFFCTRIEI